MARCNCSGSTCSCKIVGGYKTTVTGTGTAADPYVVARDTTNDTIQQQISFVDTTTVDFTVVGGGTTVDPLIVRAAVVLVAPNGSKWSLAVSNAGVLSAVAI